jgi:hypothetical protein
VGSWCVGVSPVKNASGFDTFTSRGGDPWIVIRRRPVGSSVLVTIPEVTNPDDPNGGQLSADEVAAKLAAALEKVESQSKHGKKIREAGQ